MKPQILKRSKGFTKKAGSIIYINLKIFPHKKVRIGVIKGGKVKKYYEVTTGLEKEIPVKDTDTYSVFVQNMTNSTINANELYITMYKIEVEKVMSYEQLKNPCNTKRLGIFLICIIYRYNITWILILYAKYIRKKILLRLV